MVIYGVILLLVVVFISKRMLFLGAPSRGDIRPNHSSGERVIRDNRKSVGHSDRMPEHATAADWLSDVRFSKLDPVIRMDFILRKLASSDPSEAIKLLDAEPEPRNRLSMISSIVEEWSKISPENCFKWSTSLVDQNEKARALTVCTSNIAESGNKALAFKILDELPKGGLKDRVFINSIGSLIDCDREEAIKRIPNISTLDMIRHASELLAEDFVKRNDMAGISSHWEELPFGSFRDAFGKAVIATLVEKEPALGMDWALRNIKEGESSDSLETVADAFATRSPIDGLKRSDSIPDPILKGKFIEQLSMQWATRHPSDAGIFLSEAIANDGYETCKSLATGVIYGILQTDHEGAFAIVDNIANKFERADAQTRVIKKLSILDPKEASLYLARLSNLVDINHSDVVVDIASTWLERDPLAASEWIGNLPVGLGRDGAVERLVSNILIKDKDVEMANSWAALISDQKHKDAVIKRIQKQSLKR